MTTRDTMDRHQPFTLRIAGEVGAQTVGTAGRIYDIAVMDFFEGSERRGYTGCCGSTKPLPGRRVIAQPMQDPVVLAHNPPTMGAPNSTTLGRDGSMAAFVPARRAMSWSLGDGHGTAVVRERYWVTFQPGEVRVCTSCHGINHLDQAGQLPPTNPPEALTTLLNHWKTIKSAPDSSTRRASMLD